MEVKSEVRLEVVEMGLSMSPDILEAALYRTFARCYITRLPK